MTADDRHFLSVAVQAAREAAKIHRYHADGDLAIETKSTPTDLVTKVDRLSEERIREVLQTAFPDHLVLGEEQGQTAGQGTARWIVDPLDGTVNYAHGFPFYCVSIGLEIGGDIRVGVVLDSVRDELFTAVKGQGAWLNGRPIRVSVETDSAKAMLATGFSYQQDVLRENLDVFVRALPQVRSIRRPGAAALDLCYVACGRLDGFWELRLNPWDVAAGVLVIREAGGAVTGPAGGVYQLGERVLVASNGHIHGKLLHILGLDGALA